MVCFSQPNTNISNYTFWDTEPSIAIDPINSNNLIAAWMKATGIGSISVATSYSNNAGITWSTPLIIPHLYSNYTSADVSVAFNNNGTAYLCYIDFAVTYDSGYVMVAKSINGGQTWGTAVKVTNGLATPDKPIDRPWIAIDNSGGAYNGRLYVVSKSIDVGAMPHHIWMKYSADNGATWSNQTLVDDSIPSNLITNSMGVPTVGADGSLYIGYMSYNPSQSPFARIICLKSTDGGNNFIPYIIGYPVASSPITDSLYQGSIVLSANPANAGNIVFTFTDQRNGDPDILSTHSSDGGITWTNLPVRVNDDAFGNGVGQDMCWAGFSSTGKYAVTWRDRRNTGGISASLFEVYTSISIDGGATFSPNYKISSATSPFINIQKGNDFLGVCLDDNYVYNNWCDQRTGNNEIFVNRVSMNLFAGIRENTKSNELQLKIFPNPTSANATILFQLKQKQFLKITLCDIQGKIIKTIVSQNFTEGEQRLQINTSDLNAGSYLVCLQTENQTIVSTILFKVER